MSEANSPVSAMFDLQRNAIEQTHEAVKRGVDTQRKFGEAFVDFGPAKQANERSYNAVRTVVDTYFDAVESTTPGQQDLLGDFRTTIDEQLDALEANQAEAIETIEANAQDGSESVDELFERITVALDKQSEAVLGAHADVEEQTVEAVEDLEGNLEELQAEFETQGAQFEEQVTELQQHVEDMHDDIAEIADQQAAVQGKSIDTIEGIGSTYVDRLQEQGIESFEALAEASTDTVAETAVVSREQANEWIEAAQPQA
jgi:predicted flap endonuclease-1-like 5' DNA nuclease